MSAVCTDSKAQLVAQARWPAIEALLEGAAEGAELARWHATTLQAITRVVQPVAAALGPLRGSDRAPVAPVTDARMARSEEQLAVA